MPKRKQATVYQVLYGATVETYTTRKEAEARAEALRQAGHKKVQVWDTTNNPLSRLLRL